MAEDQEEPLSMMATISVNPCEEARASGVEPLQDSARSARARTNSCTQDVWWFSQATNSGVVPSSVFAWFTSAPRPSNASTMLPRPFSQAINSGVAPSSVLALFTSAPRRQFLLVIWGVPYNGCCILYLVLVLVFVSRCEVKWKGMWNKGKYGEIN